MKWWQVMTLDGVRPSIPGSVYLALPPRPSILRRPHHEIHFNAIAEAEYHPRFAARDASDILTNQFLQFRAHRPAAKQKQIPRARLNRLPTKKKKKENKQVKRHKPRAIIHDCWKNLRLGVQENTRSYELFSFRTLREQSYFRSALRANASTLHVRAPLPLFADDKDKPLLSPFVTYRSARLGQRNRLPPRLFG